MMVGRLSPLSSVWEARLYRLVEVVLKHANTPLLSSLWVRFDKPSVSAKACLREEEVNEITAIPQI